MISTTPTPSSSTIKQLSTMDPTTTAPVVDNSVRSRTWFLTSFDSNRFMVLAAYCQGIDFHSFDQDTMAMYNEYASHGFPQNMKFVFSSELAPTTGRLHFHIGIRSEYLMSRRQLQALFGSCDMRPAKGKPFEIKTYIAKAGNPVYYYGDRAFWDEDPPRLTRHSAPIDWPHVFRCCAEVRTFKEFKRQFIDTEDADCVRAAISKCSFVQTLIGTNSPLKRVITHEPAQWQHGLVTACAQDPVLGHRKIWWVWSPESGTGKSTIVDLLIQNDISVFIFPVESGLKDALGMYQQQKVVVFDVPRDGRLDPLYPLLEAVSDQTLLSSGKYQGTFARFLSHTIVLSNHGPEHARLPGRIEEIKVKPLADETFTRINTQLSFD